MKGEEVPRYYNYYQDYDPSVGRYLQSDPIGLDGGINTYGCAEQNPLFYTDSLGLIACGWGDTTFTCSCKTRTRKAQENCRAAGGIPLFPDLLNEEEAEPESCPSSDPEKWEKIPGSNQAYRPKREKEPIFEKDRAGDRAHGGSKWTKWDKKKDWEKGKPRDGTYDETGKRLRD
ncbi:RHS repeat-associated core domain-containing protein [uncultured Microbulbifer sp.]|uniref:RHS repeat-associated core domain-containing protein n=1 Tax=uncultured Microbulbifer sp. TaxID=348147 RepID=UPI002622B7BB|nr:RHS repeat-associated core domain-containing protein [uncultured Microbulbifer sp.]